jgi:hypothetical protein
MDTPISSLSVGDTVTITDYSDAHDDTGTVWRIQDNGIALIELENGCLWPTAELKLVRKVKR